VERRLALVTGSNGFIGRNLCPVLERKGWEIRRAVRSLNLNRQHVSQVIEVGDIAASYDWSRALAGVDSVVHLAARVHLPGDSDDTQFRRTNTDATLRLAEAAAQERVRRFIYLSSVKVMGESSGATHPLTESDPPKPADAYARSKLEAEKGLRGLADRMEVAIIRPPLVYGPAVGANFLRLLRWVDRGVWLPFGAVANQRSLLYVGNLASAIAECMSHPAAAGGTFLVSDGEDVSTADLIRRMASALDKAPRCWSVPPSVLSVVATALGRGEQARRLLDSLQIDSSLIRDRLEWVPPYSMDEGLKATAVWFRECKTSRDLVGARTRASG
jgi:nucleoside-diphosphate-sugar epimerase